MSHTDVPSSPTTAEPRPSDQHESGLRKVVAASMAGTVIEWYEFFLYGSIAATGIFSATFFPGSDNKLTGIMAAFATYAVGFIARPLGGLVFGHFGDRLGRKKLLQVSLLMVGAATFLIGCLPTFSLVGWLAPILLVTLRFIQGFAVGGEWGGAVLLVAEHSDRHRRGFWGSWPQGGVPGGNLVATIVLLVLSSTLSTEAYNAWGWRVAFWLSAVIVLIGYYIRKQVDDAPIFLEAREREQQNKRKQATVGEVLRRYPKGVLISMGARLTENIMYYAAVTFSMTYLTVYLDMKLSNTLWMLLIAHTVHLITIPLWGGLSDRIGRRPVFLIGSLGTIAWAFSFFPMLDTRNAVIITLGIVTGLVLQGAMYAPQPAIMAELFPTRMRYSGISFGYQVTSILAGSLAPLICTLLLDAFGSSVPIAIYITVAAIISTAAILWSKETRGVRLEDVDAEEERRLTV